MTQNLAQNLVMFFFDFQFIQIFVVDFNISMKTTTGGNIDKRQSFVKFLKAI